MGVAAGRTDMSDRGHLVGEVHCGVPGADDHDALP
jgi:hypothetical protein